MEIDFTGITKEPVLFHNMSKLEKLRVKKSE